MFRSYVKNFIRFNKTNDIGNGLLIVAMAVDVVYIFLAGATQVAGSSIQFGWWAVLPVLLTIIAVTHLVVRPIVSAHYESAS